MASYAPAMNRILFLMGKRPALQSTPATISGDAYTVKSYQLTIINKVSNTAYHVHPADNSPTTNRHIRAGIMALESLGFRLVDTDPTDGTMLYTTEG